MYVQIITAAGERASSLQVSVSGNSERRLRSLGHLLGIPLSEAASLALRHGLAHPSLSGSNPHVERRQREALRAL